MPIAVSRHKGKIKLQFNYIREMIYSISKTRPGSRFISILAEIPVEGREVVEVQLPSWRPGRYEIGNFAKNIRKFEVYSQDGEALSFQKLTKDRWRIQCAGRKKVRITYEYFAASLDAGSTFSGKDILYVNPVNCLVYDEENFHQPNELLLNVPDHYTIASSMTLKGKRLFADSFEELADAPIIASPHLEHYALEEAECTFHIWIQGKHGLKTGEFIEAVKKYTQEQVNVFGEIESKEFHYLFIFLPTRFHHGVEHHASTVIVMGPGAEFGSKARFNELLAISSHELFHYWNVKRIRPIEMFPYDYTRQNYSRLGYVYEGITTYYGDYMLLRSGAINFEDYLSEFNSDLQKHFDNEGRYNYSVAESSFDTWLDGYVPGVPGRKVSIYTEGMLAAFMLDIDLRTETQGANSLDTVMNKLYHDFYKQGKAYSEKDFQELVEKVGGKSYQWFFDDFYHGKGQIEKALPGYLDKIGCKLVNRESDLIHESRYGFRIGNGQKVLITTIWEDSPAERAGLSLNDEVLLINNTPASAGIDWNQLFSRGSSLLVWNSIEGAKQIDLIPTGERYFQQFFVEMNPEATEEQKAFFRTWSKN